MEVTVQGKKFTFENGQVKFLANGAVSLTGGLVAVDEVGLTPENAAYHIAEFERLMDTRLSNVAFAENVLRNISAQITISNSGGSPRYKYLLKKGAFKVGFATLAFCGIASLLYICYLVYLSVKG